MACITSSDQIRNSGCGKSGIKRACVRKDLLERYRFPSSHIRQATNEVREGIIKKRGDQCEPAYERSSVIAGRKVRNETIETRTIIFRQKAVCTASFLICNGLAPLVIPSICRESQQILNLFALGTAAAPNLSASTNPRPELIIRQSLPCFLDIF